MGGRLIYLMGPSGSGKDSLIGAARESLRSRNCEVVRRVITRSAESVGEDAIGVTREEFARLKAQGGFALAWSANGLDYGIPIQIDEWLMSEWPECLGKWFSWISGGGIASLSIAAAGFDHCQ